MGQMRRAWDRQPDEPDEAFASFGIYRGLGPGRKVSRVPLARGRVMATVLGWARTWSWTERARAWDDHVDAIAQQRHLDDELAIRGRVLSVLRQRAEGLRPDDFSPRGLVEALAKLAPATQRVESSVSVQLSRVDAVAEALPREVIDVLASQLPPGRLGGGAGGRALLAGSRPVPGVSGSEVVQPAVPAEDVDHPVVRAALGTAGAARPAEAAGSAVGEGPPALTRAEAVRQYRCPECGDRLPPGKASHPRRVFCSVACRMRGQTRPSEVRLRRGRVAGAVSPVCLGCGVSLVRPDGSRGRGQFYCTETCRRRAARARARAVERVHGYPRTGGGPASGVRRPTVDEAPGRRAVAASETTRLASLVSGDGSDGDAEPPQGASEGPIQGAQGASEGERSPGSAEGAVSAAQRVQGADASSSRSCRWCEGPLPAGAHPQSRYCSPRCRGHAHRGGGGAPSSRDRVCAVCGGAFRAVRPEARYCSPRCRGRAAAEAAAARRPAPPLRAPRPAMSLTPPGAPPPGEASERRCPGCGEALARAVHGRRRYCSRRCRNRVLTARARRVRRERA